MKNHHFFIIGGFIVIVVFAFVLTHTIIKNNNSAVIEEFNTITESLDPDVRTVIRYEYEQTYYYLINYSYVDEYDEVEETTIICVYNKNTHHIYYFDILDSNNHIEDVDTFNYLAQNSKRVIINPDLFND